MKYERPARYTRRDNYFLPDQGGLNKAFISIIIVGVLVFAGFVMYINHLNHQGVQRAVEHYIFPPVQRPQILINDDNGSISIHSQKHGPYGFNATKFSPSFSLGLSYISVDYIQDKETAQINIHSQAGSFFPNTQGVDLDMTVPPTADVHIYTAHGNIKLDGIQGNVSAEVKAGSLSMMNSDGFITLKNDAGSVVAHNVQGQLNVMASEGNIMLRDVMLKSQSALQASDGAITFQGTLEHNGHMLLQAHPGPVTLALPATTAFRLHIGHGSGPLNNEFGRLVNGKGRRADITVSTDGTVIHMQKR